MDFELTTEQIEELKEYCDEDQIILLFAERLKDKNLNLDDESLFDILKQLLFDFEGHRTVVEIRKKNMGQEMKDITKDAYDEFNFGEKLNFILRDKYGDDDYFYGNNSLYKKF